MSERGSFVTEYIYCDKCLESAKKILLDNRKHFRSIVIPGWAFMVDKHELPIIAGKVGGLYRGEELDAFDLYLRPHLSKVICHPLRIAVLAESGERIFTINPVR